MALLHWLFASWAASKICEKELDRELQQLEEELDDEELEELLDDEDLLEDDDEEAYE